MIVYDLVDVFLLGALIVAPTALVVVAWKVYVGDFD
jgi:hypothetical protein